MGTPLVEFRDVTKRFGDRTVFDGINLRIYENQITTIIGKSGTGKSVLLKHIIGLLKPDGGAILFQGKPVDEMKKGEWDAYLSQISYLFQGNALFDSMTVFDNVALPLRQTTDLGRKEIRERVMTRLEQTELVEVADKYPSELSGGMQNGLPSHGHSSPVRRSFYSMSQPQDKTPSERMRSWTWSPGTGAGLALPRSWSAMISRMFTSSQIGSSFSGSGESPSRVRTQKWLSCRYCRLHGETTSP